MLATHPNYHGCGLLTCTYIEVLYVALALALPTFEQNHDTKIIQTWFPICGVTLLVLARTLCHNMAKLTDSGCVCLLRGGSSCRIDGRARGSLVPRPFPGQASPSFERPGNEVRLGVLRLFKYCARECFCATPIFDVISAHMKESWLYNSGMAQTTQLWLQAIQNCMKKVRLNISTVYGQFSCSKQLN